MVLINSALKAIVNILDLVDNLPKYQELDTDFTDNVQIEIEKLRNKLGIKE